ncbi:MAG: methyltransferase domain-containing protein [Alphaproteobacteria bacterium]|nr:methyltransferase domain-containing protein [Alphaproteobacteria bacterium]
MDDHSATIRHWYAEDMRLRAPVRRNMNIVDAYAAVPRERFMGPGPWTIRPDTRPDDTFVTPDAEPHWLYHDVLVAIDLERKLNNGMPSFWAHNLDHLDLRRGERVLQVGAGTGYYSAILAEIVGRDGRVIAVEHDPDLAARAAANLEAWPQAQVVAGDGRAHDPGPVDAIVVFAGSTHPAPLWLDRLAEGGRLMMPLTGANWWGFILRAQRRGESFTARSVGGVGIFPCVGGRDDAAGERLQKALQNVQPRYVPIRALHRGEPAAEASETVWYAGPGFWLEHAAAETPASNPLLATRAERGI